MSESTSEEEQYQLPPSSIWNHISKIAITEDKPIMLDYWTLSLDGKIIIGVRENGEKMIFHCCSLPRIILAN